MFNYFKTFTWPKLNKLFLILILAYFIFVLTICFFKYFTFAYNGLDLAIYNQVFYNSSLGKLFQFTIHPTSYLGDHFEILIFFLVPFYSIFKSPLTLIILQTFFLGLASVPLYLLAKKYLSPLQTLLVLTLYLFNPVTLNINLFEFHMLALAPFFILWTFYFYDQNKFSYFLVFSFLTLLVREDMAFIIFMFGLIALLDKKKIKWILTPIILSTLYFFTALKIISFFSANKSYKFLLYYKWLGLDFGEIFINFFLKFPLVLKHVLTIFNLEIILGLFLVFLFIPLYRPKYLLLALGFLIELLLAPTAGEYILRMHYGAVFLAIFSLALIFSLAGLAQNQKIKNFWLKNKDVVAILILTGLIYNFLVLGPLITFIKYLAQTDFQQIRLKNEFIQSIPQDVPLVAPYDLITNLSSREKLYALNYVFLGKQQYGLGDYPIPSGTKFVLINFDDFLTFHVQYQKDIIDYYYKGDDNLRKMLADNNFVLQKVKQSLALWERNGQVATPDLYQILKTAPEIKNPRDQILNKQIQFLGYDQEADLTSLYFKTLDKITSNYFIQLNNRLYPLGYGLYPSSEWQTGQIIKMNFFNLPKISEFKILDLAGWLNFNGLGSVEPIMSKTEVIGQINLN